MARFDTKKQLIMTDIVRYILLLLAAAAVAAVPGCSAKKSARPIVTVSIDPQKWLLDSIVGDRVEVKSLLPGDANPENFDPPLATLRDASRSLLYMKMGHLPWEDALGERLLEGNRTMKIVDTSEGIDLITDGGHAHLHNDADGDHHDHSGADPHTWTSVRNARVIASNMVNALVEADPVSARECRLLPSPSCRSRPQSRPARQRYVGPSGALVRTAVSCLAPLFELFCT